MLCNLGIVLERLERPDEALSEFEAAVRIAHNLGDPRSEGEFLGYLGLLHARQRVGTTMHGTVWIQALHSCAPRPMR